MGALSGLSGAGGLSAVAGGLSAVAGGALDPDAATWIAGVEAADGQSLEPALVTAYNEFIVGCKSDPSPFAGVSNYDAIKASCVMAGARTLPGALVPLKGVAPTNINFVQGDYIRTTGLVGDGASKYLNSNRNNDADPQNNRHIAVFRSTESGSGSFPIGASGNTWIAVGSATFNRYFLRVSQNASTTFDGTASSDIGFAGLTRNTSSSIQFRTLGATSTFTAASAAPSSADYGIFANISALNQYSVAHICYYSIGEAVDLAALDTRLTTLMAAIAAALA